MIGRIFGIAAAFVVSLSTATHCQIDDSYFGIFGAFDLPVANFADDDNFDRDGLATPGFGGGFEFTMPLGHPSFAWYNSAQIAVNFFSEDKAENEPTLGLLNDIDGGHYLLFPILTGMKLTLPVPEVPLYATGQVGFSIVTETDLDGTNWSANFEPAVSFSAAFGFGIVLIDNLNLGTRFMYLGEPEIDYDVDTPIFDYSSERDLEIWMFQAFVGCCF